MSLLVELSPDKEAALQARARARGVSAEEYASQVLEADLNAAGESHSGFQHISEIIAGIVADLPNDETANLPRDGADEHDHYLYGSPRRNT